MLRSIPADFDAETVAAIDSRLDETERAHRVRILLAIESGSRGWGFPSPDSDYDCRFIYVRTPDQYLSPWVKRDVIETPLDALLDVNGWDLGKALKLVLKGNAVVIEWLQSPIAYRGDAAFRDAMRAFSGAFADRAAIGRHYLHLGSRQLRVHFADDQAAAIKKVLYALRPAGALRWMRIHPAETLAPMHFPILVAASDVSKELTAIIEELLARKAVTNELGRAPIAPPIRQFIEAEFAQAAIAFEEKALGLSEDAVEAADALFRRFVQEFNAAALAR